MDDNNEKQSLLLNTFHEKENELNCLYKIEEILNSPGVSLDEALEEVIKILPGGFQFPDEIGIEISFKDKSYKTNNFKFTNWLISAPIKVQYEEVGIISIAYQSKKNGDEDESFVNDEKKLLKTVANRLGHFALHQDLKNIFLDFKNVKDVSEKKHQSNWRVILNLLRSTNPPLFMRLTRKLLHVLCWNEIDEAQTLLEQSSIELTSAISEKKPGDDNRPLKKKKLNQYRQYIDSILKLASENMKDEEIYSRIEKWIMDDESSDLITTVESRSSTLANIADAIRKNYLVSPEKIKLSKSTIKGMRVSLLRRFFTDDLDFIKYAKDYVKLTDFYNLINKMIFPPFSHGSVGGKSSGMFLASKILKKKGEENELLSNIKIPKTYFVASDGVLAFMHYNNLEEVLEQKYKEIEEVRLEYGLIVQRFKNAEFPPQMLKGLASALDDFGNNPLVVRSSSLLEDQMGAAFSGKYKSLFLANQGTKQERLNALTDAIAEVYASTFGPDPLEYRDERGLLDFHEEMGIMIQEVVGKKVGRYFLPAYAGVAFSNNEFRWSPRLKREDGLIRLVPGLGTRAVDRTGNDYPMLITPGQPKLRINVTPIEKIKYSPKYIDVIDLEADEFDTIEITALLREYGNEFPAISQIVSIVDGDMIREPMGFGTDYSKSDLIVSFNGLLDNTNFVKKMSLILETLQNKLNTPVDIEFASDGDEFYLLQCRPQSFTIDSSPDEIPKSIDKNNILFQTNKFVSNGKVPEITHVVYVDPLKYAEIKDLEKMRIVGRIVGKINKILPKRKFILMGPGRWGSRGDIKLGVNVTYSDINNTAMLIEIAQKKGDYVPDLSFGTHFFQDLVETSIRYLPLYPDESDSIFNYKFFDESANLLTELLPDYSDFKDVVKVIDVKQATGDKILKILLNAEEEIGIAILDESGGKEDTTKRKIEYIEERHMDHSKWRMNIAENICDNLDFDRFGIGGVYIFGSTKDATAVPKSDINLLVYSSLNVKHRVELDAWFDGWSLCISEINFCRTGVKSSGLLDVHYVTDEDIKNKDSYAIKIEGITNAVKPLKIKK